MFKFFQEQARKSAEKKIDKTFRQQIERLAGLASGTRRNEEETRRWCLDVLREGLGYSDSEIEAESKVMHQRADIVLKSAGQVFLVIECKAATVKLNKNATNQAVSYAVSVSAEWAVVTNGQRWRLFHVSPTQGVEPDVLEIFDVELLDEDGLSKEDVFFLSLLTRHSIMTGETKDLYHQMNAVSLKRIRREILAPDIIKVITRRLEERYKKNMGVVVVVEPEDIYPYLDEIFDVIEQCDVS